MDCPSVHADHPSDGMQSSATQPRSDDSFYKEEINKEIRMFNTAGARQVFERWMATGPDHRAWISYIEFELYRKELSREIGWERVRSIFERYVQCHPRAETWIRYSDFELNNVWNFLGARRCYERALEQLGHDDLTVEFYISFGEFEEKCKEFERAKHIYEYVLDQFSGALAEDLRQRILKVDEALTKRDLGEKGSLHYLGWALHCKP